MRLKTLSASVAYAKAYVNRVTDLQARIRAAGADMNGETMVYSLKESGAVRRASMDLTRILADLRAGR